ncbi:hypothetical protein ABMA28_010045 [Loxostege sticticalis]|uniref:Integrase catalytic domain-containing protein n=1 Tax=Loxostege sticticalis TaxID=481309 RepID=A0ABD0SDB6_LOXSC
MPTTRSQKQNFDASQPAAVEDNLPQQPVMESYPEQNQTQATVEKGPEARLEVGLQKKSSKAPSVKSYRARLARADEEIARLRLELAIARAKTIRAEESEEEDDVSITSDLNQTRVETWLEAQEHAQSVEEAQKNRQVSTDNHMKKERELEDYYRQDQPKLEHRVKVERTAPQPVPQATATATAQTTTVDLTALASAIATAARAGHQPRYLAELPNFYGAHYDWLAFKSAYMETASHFSEIENIARLRRSLKGKAKEAVSCLLIANAKAEEIMKTLEMRFGRADSIALSEIEKLRSLPKVNDSPREICIFASKVQNSVATLRALDRTHYLYNPEVVKCIIDKLTSVLRYRWFDFVAEERTEEPDLVKFSRFIQKEAERCGKYAPPENVFNEEPAHRNRPQRLFKIEEKQKEVKTPRCTICKGQHFVTDCTKMKEADNNGRWNLAKEYRLCFRCLRYKASDHNCRTKPCMVRGCKKTHHPLLHYDKLPDTKKETEIVTSTNAQQGHAYLKIVPVRISGPKGYYDTAALLDDGSTVTLIEADIADRVGASGVTDPLKLEGVAGSKINATGSRRVSITLHGQTRTHKIKARTIKGLNLAPQAVDETALKDCRHLQGIKSLLQYEERKPTILIGQDNWHLLVAKQLRRGPQHLPVASLTPLGWVLHGSSTRSLGRTVHYVYRAKEQLIDEEIKRYFTVDALGIQPKLPKSDPEVRAMKILEENTVKKNEDGYETSLIWKKEETTLPNNYNGALNRLYSIEKKLDRDPKLKTSYEAQIENLIKKGYAEKAEEPPTPGKTWYLPHFAVLHPNKPGKVRVVLDAAFRFGNTSLNDNLLSGPDLLQSLQGVLMRFRQHEIAVAADIEEMFLRISIRKQDRDALRFLWRQDRREGPPTEYRMTTVIFGATCSPSIALYVKNLNAEKHRNEYPEAANAIINHHYMDDYLQSFQTVDVAQKITKEVDHIHKKANFHLRKWTSNNSQAIKYFEDSPKIEEIKFDDGAKEEKILGLIWQPRSDSLAFNLNFSRVPSDIIDGLRTPTKREALKTVMAIFDPLGIASPIVIQGKHILQETWRTGVEWDQQLPTALASTWKTWIEDLKQLKSIQVPRCHSNLSNAVEREIHTFVDASERAYAAVVYWRVIDSNGNAHVSLIAAKARVAPLKITSIPRLELQAAVIGSRLANTVITEYDIKPDRQYYWSDSKTVLAWLRAGPRSFKPYVAHRIAEIEETTNVTQWRWVPTSQNVADDATRNTPKHFDASHRWFTGPSFLRGPVESWPQETEPKLKIDTEEARVNLVKTNNISLRESLPDVNRFSSWLRLIRATALVLKFIDQLRASKESVNYKRTRKNKEKDPQWKKTPSRKVSATQHFGQTTRQPTARQGVNIEVSFIKRAESLWVKAAQEEMFHEEINALRNNRSLPTNSRLDQRTKFKFIDGKIRVASRIAATNNITSDQKEPAVLDGNHRYTKLYLAWIHEQLAHAGIETTVNEARQHYWIVRLRPVTRSIVKQCQKCRLRRATPTEPPTGNHPRSRLAHHQRPFTFTGVDYFGPLSVTVGRHHEKRYVALFTCLTTRAVHLELAADLTADAAIMALRRMIARRGTPTEIYSDNGTNFHGADRDLREAVKNEATKRSIIWRYLPASAPFMGGAWERLVRSVKTALSCVLHEQHPREEVLRTLLCEVEYIVNSRPLTHVSTSPEDEEALTPNHFLIGGSGRVQSPGTFTATDIVSKQHWRRAQLLADQFWARWIREYLPELQHRREPQGHGTPLKTGDLVLIVDPNLPRNTWPRGKVIATYPGQDGVVRAADVKTRGGIMRRPTKRLVILPTEQEDTV